VPLSATTLYITDAATGVSFEKVTGSGGSAQCNLYVRGDDRLAAHIGSTRRFGRRGLHRRHALLHDRQLGSIAIITDGEAAKRTIQ
jgi:hypothetical protein